MITVVKETGDVLFFNENEHVSFAFSKDEKKFWAYPTQPTAHIGLPRQTIEVVDVAEVIYTNEAQPTALTFKTEKTNTEHEKRQDGVFVQNLVELGFSVRTLNILYAADIRTVADLTKMHKTDILKLRNAGKGTLKEIDDFFEKYGLKWAQYE